ncbi:MAG: ankyrin repeat domain-containing protein [Rickettsiaceae bacterium]|nr:ankyrin repeat domain-containing protein [Rickettsiaceae bacterium]
MSKNATDNTSDDSWIESLIALGSSGGKNQDPSSIQNMIRFKLQELLISCTSKEDFEEKSQALMDSVQSKINSKTHKPSKSSARPQLKKSKDASSKENQIVLEILTAQRKEILDLLDQELSAKQKKEATSASKNEDAPKEESFNSTLTKLKDLKKQNLSEKEKKINNLQEKLDRAKKEYKEAKRQIDKKIKESSESLTKAALSYQLKLIELESLQFESLKSESLESEENKKAKYTIAQDAQKLKDELEEKEKALAEAKKDQENILNKFNQDVKQIQEEIKSEVSKLNSEESRINKEIEDTTQALEQFQQERQQASQAFTQEKFKAYELATEELAKEQKNLGELTKAFQTEARILEQIKEQYNNEINALSQKIDENQTRIDLNIGSIEVLAGQIKESKQEIKKLESKIRDDKTKLEKDKDNFSEQDKNKLNEEIRNNEAKKKKLKDEQEQKEIDLAKSNKILEIQLEEQELLKKEKEELNQKKQEAYERYLDDKTIKYIEKSKQESEELAKKEKVDREVFANKALALKELKLKSKEKDVITKLAKTENAKAEYDQAEKEYEELLKAQVEETERNLANAKQSQAEIEHQLSQKRGEYNTQYQNITSRVEQSQNQYSKAIAEFGEASREFEDKKSQYKDSLVKLEDAKADLSRLKADEAFYNPNLEAFKQDLTNAQEANEALKKLNQKLELKKKLDALDARLQKIKKTATASTIDPKDQAEAEGLLQEYESLNTSNQSKTKSSKAPNSLASNIQYASNDLARVIQEDANKISTLHSGKEIEIKENITDEELEKLSQNSKSKVDGIIFSAHQHLQNIHKATGKYSSESKAEGLFVKFDEASDVDKKIEALTETKSQLDEDRNTLAIKIEAQEKNFEALNTQVESERKALEESRNKLEEVAKQKLAASLALEDSLLEYNQNYEAHKNAAEEIIKYEQELADKELETLNASILKVKQLSLANENLANQAHRSQDKISQLEKSLESLNKSKQSAQKQHEKGRATLQARNARIQNYESFLKKEEQALKREQEAILEKEQKFIETEYLQKNAYNNYEKANKDYVAATNRLKSLETEKNKLEQELNEKQGQLEAAGQRLSGSRDSDTDQSALNEQQSLEAETLKLKESLAQAKQEYDLQAKFTEEAKASAEEYNKQNAKYSELQKTQGEELTALKKNKEEAQKKHQATKSALYDERLTVNDATKNAVSAESDLNSLDARIKATNEELAKEQGLLREFQTKQKKTQESLIQAQKEHSELAKDYNQKTSKSFEDLTNSKAQISIDIQKIDSDILSLQTEIAILESEKTASPEENKEKINFGKAKIAHLNKHKELLENKLDEIDDTLSILNARKENIAQSIVSILSGNFNRVISSMKRAVGKGQEKEPALQPAPEPVPISPTRASPGQILDEDLDRLIAIEEAKNRGLIALNQQLRQTNSELLEFKSSFNKPFTGIQDLEKQAIDNEIEALATKGASKEESLNLALKNILTADPATLPDGEKNIIASIQQQLDPASFGANSLEEELARKNAEEIYVARKSRALIERGANIETLDGEVYSDKLSALKFANNIDPNDVQKNGQPLLCDLLSKKPQDQDEDRTAKLLSTYVAYGHDVNAIDKDNVSALHLAVYNKQNKSVQALLSLGADIDSKDKKGATPLHYAIESGNLEAARFLLENGADLNITLDANGISVTPRQLLDQKKLRAQANSESTKDLDEIEKLFNERQGRDALPPKILTTEERTDKIRRLNSLRQENKKLEDQNSKLLASNKRIMDSLFRTEKKDSVKDKDKEEKEKDTTQEEMALIIAGLILGLMFGGPLGAVIGGGLATLAVAELNRSKKDKDKKPFDKTPLYLAAAFIVGMSIGLGPLGFLIGTGVVGMAALGYAVYKYDLIRKAGAGLSAAGKVLTTGVAILGKGLVIGLSTPLIYTYKVGAYLLNGIGKFGEYITRPGASKDDPVPDHDTVKIERSRLSDADRSSLHSNTDLGRSSSFSEPKKVSSTFQTLKNTASYAATAASTRAAQIKDFFMRNGAIVLRNIPFPEIGVSRKIVRSSSSRSF